MSPDCRLWSVSMQKPFILIPRVLLAIAPFPVAAPGLSRGIWQVPHKCEPNAGFIGLRWPRQRRLRATLNFLSCQAVINSGMSAMNSYISLENNWEADGIVFSPSRGSAHTHARPASH